MRISFRMVSTAISALALVGALGLTTTASAGEDIMSQGKKLAFDKKKGNCLACHLIAGGDQPGNIGPPLIAMKARFPEKATLRAQIYDARAKNPDTIMIPFGPHGVLSDKEIDAVVEFIYGL